MFSVVEGFHRKFHRKPRVVASTPGRLDFLNTHQDYKGLPVVSIAINLRLYVAIDECRNESMSRVYSENLGLEDVFNVREVDLVDGRWFGNYIRASIIVLKRMGYDIGCFNAYIWSEIPIGAGMGSSGSLTTAFIGALNILFSLGLEKRDIAEVAYRAERDVMGIPCGRLDQYTAVYGGIPLIRFRPRIEVENLNPLNGVFLAIDSGIKHSTADIHPKRQQELDEGLKILLSMDIPQELKNKLSLYHWNVRWDELDLDELWPYLEKLPSIPRKRIVYTIKAHRSTELALKVMRHKRVSVDELSEILEISRARAEEILSRDDYVESVVGLVMTYQHRLLSQLYDVSLPILDRIVDIVVSSGCYGAKLSGAGLGGIVMGFAKNRDIATKALQEVEKIHVKDFWIVNIDKGLSIEVLS